MIFPALLTDGIWESFISVKSLVTSPRRRPYPRPLSSASCCVSCTPYSSCSIPLSLWISARFISAHVRSRCRWAEEREVSSAFSRKEASAKQTMSGIKDPRSGVIHHDPFVALDVWRAYYQELFARVVRPSYPGSSFVQTCPHPFSPSKRFEKVCCPRRNGVPPCSCKECLQARLPARTNSQWNSMFVFNLQHSWGRPG